MQTTAESLPLNVYSSAQVRAFDQFAIERCGISGFELMQRAARSAYELMGSRWPGARSVLVYCGAGNNAGDGYLVAALAQQAGLEVRVCALIDPALLSGDAALAVAYARDGGVPILQFAEGPAEIPVASDVIVDALLGTGLDRDVSGDFEQAVARINEAAAPVLALDIPSGLDADSGLVRGCAVRAEATITFVGLKTGLYLGAGADNSGQVFFAGLDLPAAVFANAVPQLLRMDPELPRRMLKARSRSSHKGLNGKVLVIGGSAGMGGAVRLAAEAAFRCGAGLVYAAVAPESVAAVTAGRPEIICRGIVNPEEISAWVDAADVIVIGPGLGRSDWAAALITTVLAGNTPLVVDADALNYLAEHRCTHGQWVLTPHPGEAGRLLDLSTANVQQARAQAAVRLADEYAALAVLKGSCSLVAGPDQSTATGAGQGGARLAVCDRGNPGMATAGMGDVLAGVIGGLIAQLGFSREIIELGVLVHAQAGDDAAVGGERGLLASDLFAHLRARVNPA